MKTTARRNTLQSSLRSTTMALAVFCVLSGPALAQTYMFNRADYATGPGPLVLALGDFNRDGRMDVVVGNTQQGSDSVSVLLGKADGTFEQAVNYAVNGPPSGIAVGDFNNDGNLDIIVTSGFQSTAGISVLLGKGDGTFRPFTFSQVGQAPTSVAVGDFNRDGKLDLAISDNQTGVNAIEVLLGNGNGTFQAPASYQTASDPRMVVVADFNHDGKPDLATVNSGSQTVSVLLGDGRGAFGTRKDFATQSGCVSLAAGDLRNVGRLDIVVGCQSNGQVAVLLSKGDGTFQTAKNYSVPAGVDVVAVGDFNGDNKLDVAVTNSSVSGLVSVLPGNGNGTLRTAVAFGTGPFPAGLGVADFNGDGRADVVTADDGDVSGNISVLLSNGPSFFDGRTDYPVSNASVTGAYSGIAAADLNGDGRPDLAVPVTNASQLSVLLNKGNGTFKPFATYNLPTSPLAVATGDFNNDGKVDVAVMNFGGSGTISVLLNAGGGTFPSYKEYSIGGAGNGIAVGDFNKDGNLDIVATNTTTNGTVSVLLGDGTGAFSSFVTYPVGNFPYGVTVGDFNHDGWPDLAVANQRDATVSILLNKGDGSGTFLSKKDYAIGGSPLSIAVGSFRGKGKPLDLAVATNRSGGGIAVLLGNGDGTFQKAVLYDTVNAAYAVVAGDFNNDRKLDLAVALNSGGSFGFISVMPGKGDGTFPTQLTLAAGAVPWGIAAADFNKDGGLDLATDDGTISGDMGAATVLLNYPVVGLLPASLSFKPQKVGTMSSPKKVMLSNPGATPLRIPSIAASGDFAETNNCPAKLTRGKHCTISVTFKPTQKGKRTGSVTMKDTARTSPQVVTLTGTGT